MKKAKTVVEVLVATVGAIGFIGICGINIDYPGWGWWLAGSFALFLGSILVLSILDNPRDTARALAYGLATVIRAIVIVVYSVGYNIWKIYRKTKRAYKAFKMEPEVPVAFRYKR